MSKRALTIKKVKVAIKSGLTVDDLIEKYGFETREELIQRINQLFHDNDTKGQSVIKQLEANAKKSRRKNPEPAPEEAHIAESEQPAKSIDELKAEEKALSDEVIVLESEHKALSQEHRSYIGKLRELQEQLKEIKQSLSSCHQKFEDASNKADAVAEKMNNLSSFRREKLAALEEVRDQIEERTSVTLFIYEDGKIEAPDHPDFVLVDDGYQELEPTLREREECLDIRMRDIPVLARLLKATADVAKPKLVCENTEVEKAFWALRKIV